jgi:hypothetical protein
MTTTELAPIIVAVMAALGLRELAGIAVKRFFQPKTVAAETRLVEAQASQVEGATFVASAHALVDIQNNLFKQMTAEIARVTVSANERITALEVEGERTKVELANCWKQHSVIEAKLKVLHDGSRAAEPPDKP